MGPRYALDEVKAAAAEDRVELGGKHFMERVVPWLRSPFKVRSFAVGVLAELRPEDFCGRVQYHDVVCDEYGIAISESLQERFEIGGLATWYVKLRLEQRRSGKTVVMASLHEPERDFDERRLGGRLKIDFELRQT